MLTAFTRKILVLGTNRTKMAAARSVVQWVIFTRLVRNEISACKPNEKLFLVLGSIYRPSCKQLPTQRKAGAFVLFTRCACTKPQHSLVWVLLHFTPSARAGTPISLYDERSKTKPSILRYLPLQQAPFYPRRLLSCPWMLWLFQVACFRSLRVYHRRSKDKHTNHIF